MLTLGRKIKKSSHFLKGIYRLRLLRRPGTVGIMGGRNKMCLIIGTFIPYHSQELIKLKRRSTKDPVMCFRNWRLKISSLKGARVKINKNS